MRAAEYRRAHAKATAQAEQLVREARAARTPLIYAGEWARFNIKTRGDIRLPPIPRGLIESEMGLLIHALCDLVMTTEADSLARWYGVLGAFGELEGILPVLPAEGSQVLEDVGEWSHSRSEEDDGS